jgi:hypothetical protein
MGYLDKKTAYLCGPIKAASDLDSNKSWRNSITPILESKYGIKVEDPCKITLGGRGEIGNDKEYFKSLIKTKKFDQLKDEFYKIVRKDLKCVDRADMLIIYHDPNVPTVGTIHELVNASLAKKPILLKYDPEHLENLNPWIFTFIKSNWIFDSWDAMYEYMDMIDSGKLDSSHWW